jgi:hypothetical protein
MIKIRSRQRITSKNKNSGEKRIKYNTDKLKEEDIKEIYQETISQALENNERREHTDIEDDWKTIKEAISNVAQSVLGKTVRQEKKPWYNDECRRAVQRRNEVRLKMINRSTRANTEEYKLARCEARSVCRRKKRDYEKLQLEKIEESYNKKEVKKFYQDVKNIRKGFQPRNDFCRDKEGNIISDSTEIRKRWVEYFSDMFKISEIEDTSNIEDRTQQRAEIQMEPPNLEEVLEVIHSFKNNKAPGIDMIPITLIKTGGIELHNRKYNLIIKVWEEEKNA